MQVAIAIAVGSGLGGVARIIVGFAILSRWGTDFPYGVLGVNLLGSFLIGIAAGLGEYFNRWPLGPVMVRHGFMTGFCGGFTTFSFFSLQTMQLIEAGRLATAALYTGATLAFSLLAVFGGYALGEAMARRVD